MGNGIGLRIKEVREKANLKQIPFAESIGITQSGVSYMEKSEENVSVDILEKVSRVYNVSLDWLIKGEGPGVVEKRYLEDRVDKLERLVNALMINHPKSTPTTVKSTNIEDSEYNADPELTARKNKKKKS